jgi:plastocyanin
MTGLRVLVVVVLSLVVAGCGGSEPGEPAVAAGDGSSAPSDAASTPETTEAAAASAGPVDLGATVTGEGMKDLSAEDGPVSLPLKMDDDDGLVFDPTYIKVQPGVEVEVKLANVGFIDHNFSVDSLEIDKDVASDKKATVTLTMPDDTALRFYCNLHSGMAGALYSEEGQDVES